MAEGCRTAFFKQKFMEFTEFALFLALLCGKGLK